MGRRRAVALVLVLVCLAPSPSGAARIDGTWVRPVDGPVARPFDPPRTRFGPGHLGVDFGAEPGTPVQAAGVGTVSFAGTVAGTLHVVVAHAGGLRTSYSFLAALSVRRGDSVRAGEVIGTSGGTGPQHTEAVLHFGLRSGDDYVDPMLLFGALDLSEVVHLAPTAEPFGFTVSEERRGLLAGIAHGFDSVLGGTRDVVAWVDDHGMAAVNALATMLTPVGELVVIGGDLLYRRVERLILGSPPLKALGVAVMLAGVLRDYAIGQRGCNTQAAPANGEGGSGHDVMVVAGITSHTDDQGRTLDLPTERLGYGADEVTYFSYAADAGDYDRHDTYAPIMDSARRLAAQMRERQRLEPGREVDLIAHSQGGVVARAFLELIYDPNDASYPPLGTVVTLASPLDGAPLATAIDQVRDVIGLGSLTLDLVDATPLPVPDVNSAAVRDLDEDSDLIRRLKEADMPDTVELTTIGGTYDYVVPGDVATGAGGRHIIVETNLFDAHHAILTDDDALRSVRAALEGMPLPCQSLTTTFRNVLIPSAITLGETILGDNLPGSPTGWVPR